MSSSRRSFLELLALAGGGIGLGRITPSLAASESGSVAYSRAEDAIGALANAGKDARAPSLRILILGGTGFTGPFQVRYTLSRGHKVTVFNRGRTHPGELPKRGRAANRRP